MMALKNISLSLQSQQQIHVQSLLLQDAGHCNMSTSATATTSSSLTRRSMDMMTMMMMSKRNSLTISGIRRSKSERGCAIIGIMSHWQKKKLQGPGSHNSCCCCYSTARGGFKSVGSCGSTRCAFAAARLRAAPVVVCCSSLQTNGEVPVRILNPAELLLEKFEAEPPLAPNSATAFVNRMFLWDSLPKSDEVQTFCVYEINDLDRESPAYLPLSIFNFNKKATKGSGFFAWLISAVKSFKGVHGIGDISPFSNKLYDGSLTQRLGITAGLTMIVKDYPGQGSVQDKSHKFFFPDRYEAMYTFYLGDLGHISVQGPFITFEDSLLTVTGGAGLFRETRGVCHLHNITPFKLLYTFHLKDIPEIPSQLRAPVVEPNDNVKAAPEASACKPGFVLPNYTD